MAEVERVRAAPRSVVSLERRVGEDEETELGELLPAEPVEPFAVVEVPLRPEAVLRALEQAVAALPAWGA